MTFKVYVRRHGERFRALCERLGLEVIHDTKDGACRRMNQLIKERVTELEAQGLPLPPEPPRPVSIGSLGVQASSCKGRGCGGKKKANKA